MKAYVKLPGLKWEGVVANGLMFMIVFFALFVVWLAVASMLGFVTFFVLNWALGIFGYHVSGLQFIAGVVILAILRSVVSYLFLRE